MARISVRIDDQLKRQLESEAREKGVRSSVVVREVLERHLKSRAKKESCLDIARRVGLVGCAKGLPPDLSVNPDYFDGFGRD